MEIIKSISYINPSILFQDTIVYTIIKLFKIELLKILIFLTLLGGCFIYVQSESHEYYNHSKNTILDE